MCDPVQLRNTKKNYFENLDKQDVAGNKTN